MRRPIRDGAERPFKCAQCKTAFKIRAHLQRHIANVHSLAPLSECVTCQRSFTSAKLLQHHQRSHQRARPYKCDACGARFKVSHHVARHKQRYHGNSARPAKPRFNCSVCLASFRLRNDLADHLHAHSDERAFSCRECGASYKHRGGLNEHIAHKHSSRRWIFACACCLLLFANKRRLATHILWLHTRGNRRIRLTCRRCKIRREISRESLNKVLQADGHAFRFRCLKCSDILPNASFDSPQRNDKPYNRGGRCSICLSNVRSKHYLSEHLRVKHSANRRPLACGGCSETFRSSAQRYQHVRTVHLSVSAVRFGCSRCNRPHFKNKMSLTHHLRLHVNAAPPHCKHCAKRLTSADILSDCCRCCARQCARRVWRCARCLAGAPYRNLLLEHMRVHAVGSESFSCAHCSAYFNCSVALLKHIKVCHQNKAPRAATARWSKDVLMSPFAAGGHIKPFVWHVCQARFSTRHVLATHVKLKHDGIKPFRCALCLSSFFSKHDLAKHHVVHIEQHMRSFLFLQ